MLIELDQVEVDTVIFALKADLQTVESSLAEGDSQWLGEDETIRDILQKLGVKDN